jgi:hypothetical protein
MTITLIEEQGLDQYTYVDTDGIIKMLEADVDYGHEGMIDSYNIYESQVIAFPWLHDFKRWWFRKNYQSCDTDLWNDLPF